MYYVYCMMDVLYSPVQSTANTDTHPSSGHPSDGPTTHPSEVVIQSEILSLVKLDEALIQVKHIMSSNQVTPHPSEAGQITHQVIAQTLIPTSSCFFSP